MEELKISVVYRLIASRLMETRQTHVILKALHDAVDDRILTAPFSRLARVTSPIRWSCQLATFVGLVSVLEKDNRSATIPTLARLVRAEGIDVPKELDEEAAQICEKYRVFRNKLFSHNSVEREELRKEFDDAKISWAQLDTDFDATERILFQIADRYEELSLDVVPLMMLNDVSSTESTMKELLSKLEK